MSRRDLITVSMLSVVFLLLSSLNLGLFRTPITYLQIKGPREVRLALESRGTISSIYMLVTSSLGMGIRISNEKNVSETRHFQYDSEYYLWRRSSFGFEADSLLISFESLDLKIYEIAAFGPSGERLTIRSALLEGSDSSDSKKLFDEQEFFDTPPTFISEMYFDEVYFVRAAQDYLSMNEPAEWTHPPLGKLIIASGIAIFSDSPFGWRITGVIFATLMIPVIYILSKRIFKSTLAATVSSLLLCFDFLHFSMARIGTVDTYLVFFSLMSALFFYMSFESLSTTGKPVNRFIIIGTLFFALALAVKWTAVFGFLGQIALIMTIGLKNFRHSNYGIDNMMRSVSKPMTMILLSLVIAGLVYVSTFIPYMLIGHNLMDVYQAQWKIYGFHTELTATHPFSSEWWMWPVIIKPLWMYTSQLSEGMVSTIVAMGNPIIWWFGIPSVFLALWRGLKKRETSYLFVSILFLFQWLPYALVSRALFIYHYYPAVPIMILASSGIIVDSWRNPKERLFIMVFLFSVIAIFVLFYPVISGFPIPIWYKESLRWFGSWIF